MASLQCCLKSCKRTGLDESCGRVEVQTVLPDGGIKKIASQLIIKWTENGQAMFHEECWDDIVKTSRTRSKAKMIFPKMTTIEKRMVREAAKTCEHHDSEEVFESEAKRIAEMICAAKHCVCFTGAGISTSAGIGDYRGKSGKWTEMDREKVCLDPVVQQEDEVPKKRQRLESDETGRA